ncbi:hypothetical protein DL240_17315 [Lujinxingia litoralis]|uniref:LarA-like N-terminal domain-containing protein n=1 Tax=Lujinxingia litoralis TaxID=2211119 RepID=A0A328C3F4_9DELT|nr:lactate racemase domain-containing protein [Lujinxingia litoralis]RAL20341.1 hypothetical protein DL240_17315 [Lujinxingia litoralis]
MNTSNPWTPPESALTRAIDWTLATSDHTPELEGKRLLVVIPDTTRPLDLAGALYAVLSHLRAGEPASISVLVALGLHRALALSELRPLLTICRQLGATLTQHTPHHPRLSMPGADVGLLSAPEADALVGYPQTRSERPLPALLHPMLFQHDRILVVGTVEPHQYAGFSGGVKALAIGCAGAETIATMHGLELLRHPGTRLGRIDNNPFQEALWRVADLPCPIDALQIVPGTPEPRALLYGPVRPTFERACQLAGEAFFYRCDEPLPWLHIRLPPSKADNFYQASRAATYAALLEHTALAPGGWIVLEAECHEGVGRGDGERAFARAMQRGKERLLAELRGQATSPEPHAGGQQRAYVLALALDRNPVALITPEPLPELDTMGIRQFRTLKEAHTTLNLPLVPGVSLLDIFTGLPVLATDENAGPPR